MTEYEICLNPEIREKYMERIEVLDKVKKLFLIPGMEVMTTKQVADYFEVGVEAIQSLYLRNREEIESDGVVLKKPSDFQNLQNEDFGFFKMNNPKNKRGVTTFQTTEGNYIEVNNGGTKCFSQRAILRIAMLLRDSSIAKEIRTQLLNTFENASEEDRVYSIDEEQILWAEFGKALVSGDMTATLQAVCDVQKYHNRHVDALTKANDSLSLTNKCLTKETRTWDKRKVVVAMIRSLASRVYHSNYIEAYKDFYKELRYKKGICLSQRTGSKNKLDNVKDDEWDDLIQVATAMLEEHGIPVADIINETNMDTIIDTESTMEEECVVSDELVTV